MSARARVPAAHPQEERPAVPAERESLSAAASRQAGKLPPPEREGKEAAREERNALATSAGARGEPLPAPVLGHSVPQAAVSVKPLALHLAHKARGQGGPFGWEPPPPLPRDSPAEDAREEEKAAAAGSEEKLPPPPPPPPLPRKENPWTKKPPQHLSPAGTGPPPLPPLETLEAGLWLLCGGHREGVCRGDSRGGRGWRGGVGEGQASVPCQSEVFRSKVSFTLPVYINGHLGREQQEEVGPRVLLDWWGTAGVTELSHSAGTASLMSYPTC